MGPGLYGSGPVVGLKDLNLVCGDKDTGEVTQFRSDRMSSSRGETDASLPGVGMTLSAIFCKH